MREVAILGSIISSLLLLCLSCGCDRKTLIKSELDNPLVAEELRAVSGGGHHLELLKFIISFIPVCTCRTP